MAELPYPAVSAALVEALATVAGLELDTGELHTAAASVLTQIDEVLANSAEHRELVRGLEAAFDGAAPPPDFSDLPSGAELERFLRGEQEGN